MNKESILKKLDELATLIGGFRDDANSRFFEANTLSDKSHFNGLAKGYGISEAYIRDLIRELESAKQED